MTFKLPALAGALLSGLLLATPAAEAASTRVPVTPPATVIIQSPNRPMAVPAPGATTATTTTTTSVGGGSVGNGTAGGATARTTTSTMSTTRHHRTHHPRHPHHARRHHWRGAGVKETPFDAANCGRVPTSCSRIHSCAQARRALACGATALDPDHDGVPCEKVCG